MGLDVSVGEYESPQYISERLGSCHGYSEWRSRIAECAGFELDEMVGFGGAWEWTNEPFQLVLNHSDCDGGYAVEVLSELLEELNKIKKLNVDDYDQSEKFIRLCSYAMKLQLPIKFG